MGIPFACVAILNGFMLFQTPCHKVPDNDGDTPLMIAAHEGNVEAKRLAIAANASKNT